MENNDRRDKAIVAYYEQFGYFPPGVQGIEKYSDHYLDIIEQQTKNKDRDKPGFFDSLPPGACS